MSSEPELDPIVSDEEGDTEGATSPTETVEFGWQDDKPVSGRRKAQEKQKRKIKPGSFGIYQCFLQVKLCLNSSPAGRLKSFLRLQRQWASFQTC